MTALRRKGLAIAADDTFNAPAGQKRVLCKKCGLGPDCGPITLAEIGAFDGTAIYTLFDSVTITACQTLDIPFGIFLQISSGLQLTNNGTINVTGTLDISAGGTIFNKGYINIAALSPLGGNDGQLWLPSGAQLINKGKMDVAGNITSSYQGMNGTIYNSGATINLSGLIIDGTGGGGGTATIYNYGGAVINGGNNISGYGTYQFSFIYTGDPATCGAGTINGAPNVETTAATCPTAPYP
jgi:hypothetical protein